MNVRARMEDSNYPPGASPRIYLRRIRSRKLAGSVDDDPDSGTVRHVGEADSGQPWMESLWQRVQDSSPSSTGHHRSGCTIFKVPGDMRRHSPRLYQPSVVPIGPYHCGYGPPRARDSQFTDAQGFKWACLAHLLRRQPHVDPRDSLERCVDEMRALEAKARGCYARPIEMDENEYVEMLLLDGCFILHLILDQRPLSPPRRSRRRRRRESSNPLNDDDDYDFDDDDEDDVHCLYEELVDYADEGPKLPESSWLRNRILQDLLLVENQIPFFVVQHLFFLLRTPREANVSLLNLALDLFANIHPMRNPEFSVTPSVNVHHLLHLVYLSILPSKPPKHLDYGGGAVPSAEGVARARELIAKRTKLKRREEGKGDPCSFMDVRFHDGVIEVPSLQVWDYSSMLFSNLVAFEQCYHGASGQVMAYIAFMDLVVNGAGRGRRKKEGGDVDGVFVNMQRGDRKVGEFFEGLCAHVSIDCAGGYLMDLLEEEASRPRATQWKYRGPAAAAAVAVLVAVLVFFLANSTFVPRN